MSPTSGISLTSNSYTQAKRAYERVLKANSAVKINGDNEVMNQKSKINILRQGGIVDVVSQSNTENNTTPTFAQVIKNTAREKLSDLRRAEAKTREAVEGNANMVEVMTAVNQSEIALQQVVAFRNEVVKAYNEILRMAL